MTVNHNTYFHTKDRETFSSYHYSEYMKDNFSIETRVQLLQDIETSFDKLSANYGMRLKYQEILAMNHFYNEPANYYDLTRDLELIRVPDSSFGGDSYYAGKARAACSIAGMWVAVTHSSRTRMVLISRHGIPKVGSSRPLRSLT